MNLHEIVYGRMDAFLPTEEEFLPITDEYYQKSQFQKALDNLKEGKSGAIFFTTPYHQTCSGGNEVYLAEFRQEGTELILWVVSEKPTEQTEFFRNLGFHAFSELQNTRSLETLRITLMSSFYRDDPKGMSEQVYKENLVPDPEFLKRTIIQ